MFPPIQAAPRSPILIRLSPRKRLLFSTLVTAALLGALEGASRIWLHHWAGQEEYIRYAVPEEFPTAAKYIPHHYLCYALQPHYRRGATRHNALGFRGPEIRVPKPDGIFRIAILGGSTTYSEFIGDDRATFPSRFEQELHARGHGHVEVINAGCPGYNSWESLVNLEFRVLDLEPDLVILYEGVNDVHARLVRPDHYQGDNSGRRVPWSPPIETRILRHSVLARIAGAKLGLWRLPGVDSYVQAPTADPGAIGPSPAFGDPMAALDQNPPSYFERNLVSMVAVAAGHGRRALLATWAHSDQCGDYAATEHYQRGFREHNEIVRAVAVRTGAPLFDFARRMPTARALWRDGRHVNEEGARLQGSLFADYLASHPNLLRPGRAPIQTAAGGER